MILIFSVNESGHFQGYAQMASRIGREVSSAWNDGRGSATWGGSFKVKWLKMYHTFNSACLVFEEAYIRPSFH